MKDIRTQLIFKDTNQNELFNFDLTLHFKKMLQRSLYRISGNVDKAKGV